MPTVHGFTYIPRTEWGSQADGTAGGYPIDGAVPDVIHHHFYSPDVPASASPEDEAKVMRAVERDHISRFYGGDVKRGAGTGYQWVHFASGRSYEGRGVGRTGAHTEGRNSSSVGSAHAINGDRVDLTPAAIRQTRALIGMLLALGRLRTSYGNHGHHDFAAKSCPGTLVYPTIDGRFANLTAPAPPAPAKPTWRVAVVVRANRLDGTPNVIDIEQARVLAQRSDGPWKLLTWPHPGITVGYAICVGVGAAELRSRYPAGEVIEGGAGGRMVQAFRLAERIRGPRIP